MIEVACDGSAAPTNPGPAGWGWYRDESCWAAGGAAHATNQAMELQAVLDFLQQTQHLPSDTPITLFLDSRYTIDCLTKWHVAWRRNGWKNSKGERVKNREIIEPALDLLEKRSGVTFTWVKGHAGHALNDRADAACTAASSAIHEGRPVPTGPGWTDENAQLNTGGSLSAAVTTSATSDPERPDPTALRRKALAGDVEAAFELVAHENRTQGEAIARALEIIDSDAWETTSPEQLRARLRTVLRLI